MLSSSYLRTYIKIRKHAGRTRLIEMPGGMSCPLLCRPCHIDRGAEDRPEPPYGYYRYLYWYCRCATCKAANAATSAGLREQRLQARERSRALGGQTVPSDRPDLG